MAADFNSLLYGEKSMKVCNWIGHKFRPRYDSGMPKGFSIGQRTLWDHGPDAFKDKVYRLDICERCGSVVDGPRKSVESGAPPMTD